MEKSPKINIIYEDNHLLVVEKPIDIPVQADNSHDLDLLTILKNYLKVKYHKPGNVYLGLVHRLDRPVGGIMVFAKTSKSASRLADQVRTHKLSKTYLAVIEGKITPSKGILTDYLIKDKQKNISYVTTKDKGKLSNLEYLTISSTNNQTLIKINLITGRSHQIRVQFSHHSHPLIGDQKYNNNATPNTHIALFASSLSFFHPITNQHLTFTLPIPKRYPFNQFN